MRRYTLEVLFKIADKLDQMGFYEASNEIDSLIKIATGFRFDPNSTENEGRWRLKDPKIYKKFWRRKDENDAGIGYVMGKEKSGKTSTQAIRFNKNKWTEAEAKKWWNKNKSRFTKTWTEKDWSKWKKENAADDSFTEKEHDWDEVLIDKDGTQKTRGQIKDYYEKNGTKLLPYLKDKDVIVLLGIGKNKTVLKRNIDGGEKIHITKKDGIDDPSSLEYWINRRAIEFHSALTSKTKLVWVDLDPKTDDMRSEAQKLTSKVGSVIKKVFPNAKIKVWDSGKRGFHVEGYLTSEVDTDSARHKLKEALDDEFENNEDVTTGLAKDNQIRLDTTTLKNTGSIRAPYSFSVDGRPKIPLASNDADDSDEIKIYTKSVTSLSPAEHSALFALTNEAESAMKEVLGKYKSGAIAVIAKMGAKIIGWASVLHARAIKDNPNLNRLFFIGVFVEPQYRRTGIGKKLGMEATRQAKKCRSDAVIMAQGIDERAVAFYSSLGLKDLGPEADKMGRTYHSFTNAIDDEKEQYKCPNCPYIARSEAQFYTHIGTYDPPIEQPPSGSKTELRWLQFGISVDSLKRDRISQARRCDSCEKTLGFMKSPAIVGKIAFREHVAKEHPEIALCIGLDKLAFVKKSDYFSPISFMKLKKIKSPDELLKKYDPKNLAIQPKIDGFKIMATKDGAGTKLLTRRGKDVSANVPEIVEELNKYLPHGTTILGELTVINDGQSISETQTLLGSNPGANIEGNVVYYVYDILEKDGKRITERPWQERDTILRSLLKDSKHLKLVKTYTFEQKEEALNQALQDGGEGIVIKVKTSPYIFKPEGESEPTGEWFKFKPEAKAHTEDVFLDKYTLGEPDPKGHRKAIFPAYQYKNGKAFEVGKLSGMDRNTEASIKSKIDSGERVVVEVSYQERMPSGKLRHMGWVRLRPDKPLKSVVMS